MPRTNGERLQIAMAAYEAARIGTATEARELALQALAGGLLYEDPGPESGGFWIAPFALLLAHADDDETRITTEVIEWAKRHGSLPAFSMAAQLRAYAYLRSARWPTRRRMRLSALEHPVVPGFPLSGASRSSTSCSRGTATEARDVFAVSEPRPPVTSATC